MVHLMFGLEGSGFIISISLTFLLVGLVVYLMKRQIRGLEQKFCSIFEISQNLATSIEHIKSTQIERRKEVHIENYNGSESENNTDEEDEEEDCPEGICPINRIFESIKVIDINDDCEKPFNFENNALEQILNSSSIKDLDNKNKENMNDFDYLDEDEAKNEGEEQTEDEVEDETEDEVEDEDEDETEDEAEDEAEDEDEDDKAKNDNETKKDKVEMDDITKNNAPDKINDKKIFIRKNVSKDITDYHKLKVPDLRDLVVKQKILSEREAKTIKKQKLVDLLKKNN